MQKGKLANIKNKHIRLRPIHRRFDGFSGFELPPIDNKWFVSEAGHNGVVIKNDASDHTLSLAADQIREFQTDPSGKSFGFLVMKGQVWVSGKEAGVEPLLVGVEEEIRAKSLHHE